MDFLAHLFTNCHGELTNFALVASWAGFAIHWVKCHVRKPKAKK